MSHATTLPNPRPSMRHEHVRTCETQEEFDDAAIEAAAAIYDGLQSMGPGSCLTIYRSEETGRIHCGSLPLDRGLRAIDETAPPPDEEER